MPNSLSELSSLLQGDSTLFITVSVILGLMVGSFLNVVIYRLPKMMEQEWHNNCLELQGKDIPEQQRFSLSTPRSSCPQCGHKITVLENIPMISYLLLKGRCSACKTPINMRYPLVELLTAGLIGLVSWQFGFTTATLFAWVFVFALIVLTFIDFDTQLLPDDITLPLLWLGLLFNLNGGFTDLNPPLSALWPAIWFYGRYSGCLNLFVAKKAWVTVTLSC